MARKWIGYIGVGSLMCAALGCGILYTRQARLQQTISDKVLRFHVLANSDSEADQNLKLAVRDAVGSYMQVWKIWKNVRWLCARASVKLRKLRQRQSQKTGMTMM